MGNQPRTSSGISYPLPLGVRFGKIPNKEKPTVDRGGITLQKLKKCLYSIATQNLKTDLER